MVFHLDKCIGCHTCSVTCKNVWTSRDGVEYAWFNRHDLAAKPELKPYVTKICKNNHSIM